MFSNVIDYVTDINEKRLSKVLLINFFWNITDFNEIVIIAKICSICDALIFFVGLKITSVVFFFTIASQRS